LRQSAFCVHDGHLFGSESVCDEHRILSLMRTVRLTPPTSTAQHPKQSHPLGVRGRQKSRQCWVAAAQGVEGGGPQEGTGAIGSHRKDQSH